MEKTLFFCLVVCIVLLCRAFKVSEQKLIKKDFMHWFYPTKYNDDHNAICAVMNAQADLKIPSECRITTEEEWEYAKVIFDQIRDRLLKDYFTDDLYIPKLKFRGIWQKQCFMFHLQSYMQAHECDDTFAGHELHAKTLHHKNYGSWGHMHYDASYELTDFAVVMQKLHYISYVHNKLDKELNPKGNLNQNEKQIEEIIKTRTISVSCY